MGIFAPRSSLQLSPWLDIAERSMTMMLTVMLLAYGGMAATLGENKEELKETIKIAISGEAAFLGDSDKMGNMKYKELKETIMIAGSGEAALLGDSNKMGNMKYKEGIMRRERSAHSLAPNL